jgi:TonB-dependent receptor
MQKRMIDLLKLKRAVLCALVLWSGMATGQKGVLTGKIFDKASGETLIGAILEIRKDEMRVAGTATDIDGNYRVEVDAGTFDVAINYLSYAQLTIAGVAITAKETTSLDISLEAESQSLEEVVVKAESIRSTVVALIALQRNASGIQDGISSQQIRRTGGSNAADAIRQMPAAVIQDGRFIVIRGLGDRYSISQLNGVTLPSTDPYRNSSSLDLIPNQIIENIISVKTFTPDLPGNFSGGLVNINTKSIPDKFTMMIEATTAYNSESSLINNFQWHAEGGKYDWLGFDDGSRNQPDILLDANNRNQLSTSTYLQARQPGNEDVTSLFNESAKGLSNSFLPEIANSPLNMGVNFAVGHRFPIFKKDFGFTVSLNYANNFQHYDEGEINTYINTNTDFLFGYQRLKESKSVQNPTLGGLLNLAYKLSDNHILSGNIIFNNDAEIVSRSQSGDFLGQVSNSAANFNTNTVEFLQRQVSNFQLGGRHNFPTLKNIQIDWNASALNSFQKEPDLRYFAYTTECVDMGNGEMNCDYYMNNAEYAFPYHFFRKLEDKGYEGKIDITIPFVNGKNLSNTNSVKVGGFYSKTERDFEEYRYQLNNGGIPSSLNFTSFDGDFDAFWDLNNFGILDTTYKSDGTVQRYVTGYHYVNQINARNFYTGESAVTAAYAMLTYNLTRSLKAIGGVRMETTDIEVVSEDSTVAAGKINLTDFLYSLNLVYALSENTNIRIAASKTLARPNMRELAPFVQFDTKNGFFNVGNPNLQRTLIQNYDLRYEIYPRAGELIAFSAFYKIFTDPIIRAFNPRATIPELSFINVDEAMVAGVELEFRKELNFISPSFKNIFFNTNLALIHSTYDIPAEEVENSQNIDPEYDQTTRPFQGQAPYVVNAILSYINPESGLEVALSYNVSGQKLYNISLFATPDVYEQPVSLLNLKVGMQFAKRFQASLTVRNILNSENLKTNTFHGVDYIAESIPLGRTIGLSLSYQIR